MKKKLLLACLIGLLSITSAYAKCDGGTEITNSVGTTFCKSNQMMNWWTAAVWCRANGLRLATMYEMCPSWDGTEDYGKCPELKGTGGGNAWSATASGSEYAFFVVLSTGSVHGQNYRSSDFNYYAFCRQFFILREMMVIKNKPSVKEGLSY